MTEKAKGRTTVGGRRALKTGRFWGGRGGRVQSESQKFFRGGTKGYQFIEVRGEKPWRERRGGKCHREEL